MKDIQGYLLLVIFAIQATINMRLFGFIPVMFTVVIPDSVYHYIAWAIPFLLLAYFLLGAASIYYMSINSRRAFFCGEVYFLFGLIGSSAVVMRDFPDTEIMYVWALSSILGIIFMESLRKREVSLNPLATYTVIALLVVSGVITFMTSSWLAEDYYIHRNIGKDIPENTTKVMDYPLTSFPP